MFKRNSSPNAIQSCTLALYTKYDTLAIQTYISGTHMFKEVSLVQDYSFHETYSRKILEEL